MRWNGVLIRKPSPPIASIASPIRSATVSGEPISSMPASKRSCASWTIADGDDRIRVAGGERPASGRSAGLNKDRLALRGADSIQRAAAFEEPALVMNGMHFGVIGISSGQRVFYQ